MSGVIGLSGGKSGIVGRTEMAVEEGTWAPTSRHGTLTASSYRNYMRIGDTIWLSASITFDSTSNGNAQGINIPYTARSTQYHAGYVGYTNYTSGPVTCIVWDNGTRVEFYKQSTASILDCAACATRRFDFTVRIMI